MKTDDRLRAIDSSADSWRARLSRMAHEDVTLMRLLRVASQGITAFIDPILRNGGLTESSYHTLVVASAAGSRGCTVTQLCDQVGQNRANMTRILKLLETEGLARAQTDRRDARRKRIVASARGKQLVREFSERLDPLVDLAMGGISVADKRHLNRILRKLILAMSLAEAEAQKLA